MVMRAENINPSMLTWARKSAGMTIERAAKKVGLKDGKSATATDKLKALERGEIKPTFNQLFKIAEVYSHPIIVFYLSEPPPEEEYGTDFRAPDSEITDEETGRLNAILRDVYVRQLIVKSVLEDDEDFSPLDFVSSIDIDHSAVDTVELIRQHLEIGNTEVVGERFRNPENLFSYLRERVANLGIFVLLIGDLGSHHTNVSERVFRGFTLTDPIAPFIVINHHDAKAAYSFTLLHELTHIFLGAGGVSGAPSIRNETTEKADVERFCNNVAGEFLLPSKVITDIGQLVRIEQVQKSVTQLATRASISESMVLYRLWQCQKINNDIYSRLAAMYQKRWISSKQNRDSNSHNRFSGPSYYTVKQYRLGKPLVELVGRSLRADELTDTEAAKVLGVKPSNVETLLRKGSQLSS